MSKLSSAELTTVLRFADINTHFRTSPCFAFVRYGTVVIEVGYAILRSCPVTAFRTSLCEPSLYFATCGSFHIKAIESESVNKTTTNQKGYHHSADQVRLVQNFFQKHYILLLI